MKKENDFISKVTVNTSPNTFPFSYLLPLDVVKRRDVKEDFFISLKRYEKYEMSQTFKDGHFRLFPWVKQR